MQYLGDVDEQGGINTILGKNAIDGSTGAVQLASHPTDGSLLPKHFLLDVLSYVYHASYNNRYKAEARDCLCQFRNEGPEKT